MEFLSKSSPPVDSPAANCLCGTAATSGSVQLDSTSATAPARRAPEPPQISVGYSRKFSTVRRSCNIRSRKPAIASSGSMFGPSLGDLSGSGCVSKNSPSTRPPWRPGPAARPSRDCRRSPRPARPAPARCAWRRTPPARPSALHLRNGPHVVHQPAVAEERAALAEQHVPAAGRRELGDDVPHVPGGHELPLLDVHRPAGLRRRPRADRSAGPGRRESAAGRTPRPPARPGATRECRSSPAGPSRACTLASTSSPASRPSAAKRVAAGAVGLVERRLEDELDAQWQR